jgi:hypothetical protein
MWPPSPYFPIRRCDCAITSGTMLREQSSGAVESLIGYGRTWRVAGEASRGPDRGPLCLSEVALRRCGCQEHTLSTLVGDLVSAAAVERLITKSGQKSPAEASCARVLITVRARQARAVLWPTRPGSLDYFVHGIDKTNSDNSPCGDVKERTTGSNHETSTLRQQYHVLYSVLVSTNTCGPARSSNPATLSGRNKDTRFHWSSEHRSTIRL